MSAQPGARLLRAGLLQALTTFDVYKPLSRKGPLSPLVFFSSWPVSELPIQTAFAARRICVADAASSAWR
jgi:hypothetical protein